jgi:hypothetical protein
LYLLYCLCSGAPAQASYVQEPPIAEQVDAALAYPSIWQAYANLCSRVVAIEAIAWSLCKHHLHFRVCMADSWLSGGILILLMVSSLVHKLRVTTKPTPEEMYFASPEKRKNPV